MKYYNKITVWETKRRLKLLKEFRDLIGTYFDNIEYVRSFVSSDPMENAQAQNARVRINLLLNEVRNTMIFAGVSPTIRYTPPRAVGGYIQDIDVTLNIFRLHRYEIRPDVLYDFIHLAAGIYENDLRRAMLRTWSPLFWLGCVFDYVASLPFALLARIGFDQDKAESSLAGRLIKGILYLIEVLAAILAILHFLGYLDQFKAFIARLFKSP